MFSISSSREEGPAPEWPSYLAAWRGRRRARPEDKCRSSWRFMPSAELCRAGGFSPTFILSCLYLLRHSLSPASAFISGGEDMISEDILGRSRLFRRLKSGPHGHIVELYAARLTREGFARHGTWRCLNVVGDFLDWIERSQLKLAHLDERVAERYLEHRGEKQCLQPGDRAALKRFLVVLRESDMIAPAPQPPITPEDRIFVGFRRPTAHLPRGAVRPEICRMEPDRKSPNQP
jgi:hypothetical protein